MKMLRVVCSALAGNALEFYDLTVYGIFASTIRQNFFPQQNKLVGIISVFAIFFFGYLARPLGAVFFGQVGDNYGRKPALLISVVLMALSTSAIGLLPDYHMIGVWAPMLLLFIRLLQGFSCGGEFTGSIIFVVEHASPTNRGFYGSIGMIGFAAGLLMASLVGWLVHHNFSELQVTHWAWRLPFFLALLGGLVSYFVRRHVNETELFLEMPRLPNTYSSLFRNYTRQVRPTVLMVFIKLFASVTTYLFYIYMVTYMTNRLGYTESQALSINIVSLILLVFLEPWMGKLSDHFGRRPLMAFTIIGSVLWVWPYFWLLQQHDFLMALLAQMVMTVFLSAYLGFVIVIMVEIVPVQTRFTVVSLAYSVESSLFSGTTPLIAALLINMTHSSFSLVFYVWGCALISAIALYLVEETKHVPQADESPF